MVFSYTSCYRKDITISAVGGWLSVGKWEFIWNGGLWIIKLDITFACPSAVSNFHVTFTGKKKWNGFHRVWRVRGRHCMLKYWTVVGHNLIWFGFYWYSFGQQQGIGQGFFFFLLEPTHHHHLQGNNMYSKPAVSQSWASLGRPPHTPLPNPQRDWKERDTATLLQ